MEQDGPQDGAIRLGRDNRSFTAAHMQKSVSRQDSSVTSIHSSSSLTSEVEPATPSGLHTPPQTPHRGRPLNNSDKASAADTQDAHPTTPPQSPLTSSPKKPLSRKPFPKRMPSSTHRRPARLVTSATYLSHFVSDLVDLSWILSELENSITAFPCAMLQLDSPVVQHFRSCQGSPTLYKTETAQVLRLSSLISPPPSRYSPLQPYTMPPKHHSRTQTNDSPSFRNQNPLRAVFPGAPAHLLNALHATTIALNHVCEIITSISSSSSTSTLTKTCRSSAVCRVSRSPRRLRGPLELDEIAPKARRVLGITRRSRTSLRPARPSSESQSGELGKESKSIPVENGLKERGEKVREELREMSRWLMDEIGQSTDSGGPDGRADTLVLALGEVVRLGHTRR